MGSSIGPAFNYLLTGTAPNGGTTLAAALVAVDPEAQLFDGWVTDRQCHSQFVIGRSGPANETSAMAGADALVTLGASRVDEDYEIPGYIQTFVGGTDQAEARNAALALWDAWIHWLSLDRTLGGALGTMWAEVGHIQIEATPEENVENGRFCLMTFSIHCKNKYIP
jgi:hypothetical protein